MPVKNLRDGTVKIADAAGTGGGNSVTVDVEEGDLTYTEKTPVHIIKDRGVLDHARLADEVPVELSFSMKYQSHTLHVSPSPYDALTKTGGASSWVSDEPNSDVYAVIIEFTMTDPAGGAAEVLTFARFMDIVIDFNEGAEFNIMKVSGKALITTPVLS
ncbi:MAG: hypothetical protein V3T08_09510 [Gemmatimonadota bacterium]